MFASWRDKFHQGGLVTKIVLGTLAAHGIFAMFCAFALVIGLIIQWLWNVTLVPLFGFPELSYWQAIGLFVLAKLFFGFGGGGQQQSKPKARPTPDDKQSDIAGDSTTTQSDEVDRLPADTEFRTFWEQEGREAYRAYLANRGEDKS